MMPSSSPTVQDANSLTMDPQYGAILEDRWVPAPRYVLRRDRILARIAAIPKGRVIDIGCGSGALLREFADRGHECTGLETSDSAVDLARELLAPFPGSQIVDRPGQDWTAKFDTLMAFEVLEHIEKDAEALAGWVRWLRPGGRVILSVPAHMAMWSQRDAWAGHFRRYGKAELVRLAKGAGLTVEKVECYGFPLSNLTHWLGNISVKGQDFAGGAASQSGATAASGTDRSTAIKYFGLQRSFVGRLIMAAACRFQRLFLSTRFGDGYLIFASVPAAAPS